jgi:hypothetical protein
LQTNEGGVTVVFLAVPLRGSSVYISGIRFQERM